MYQELQQKRRGIGGVGGCDGVGAVSQRRRGVRERSCRRDWCRGCERRRDQRVVIPGDVLTATGGHDGRRHGRDRGRRCQDRSRSRCSADGGQKGGEDALEKPVRFAR